MTGAFMHAASSVAAGSGFTDRLAQGVWQGAAGASQANASKLVNRWLGPGGRGLRPDEAMFVCNVVDEALDVGDGDPVTLQGEVALK